MKLSFMGECEPEEFRARVYDGTPPRVATVDGIHHRIQGNGAALCGCPVPSRTPAVELEPGADFGTGPKDCPKCAAVRR